MRLVACMFCDPSEDALASSISPARLCKSCSCSSRDDEVFPGPKQASLSCVRSVLLNEWEILTSGGDFDWSSGCGSCVARDNDADDDDGDSDSRSRPPISLDDDDLVDDDNDDDNDNGGDDADAEADGV